MNQPDEKYIVVDHILERYKDKYGTLYAYKNSSGTIRIQCRHHSKSSRITNNISIHLGYFISEIEASKAYDIKAKELHGDFATLKQREK